MKINHFIFLAASLLFAVSLFSCSTEGDGSGCTHRNKGFSKVVSKNSFPDNIVGNGTDDLPIPPVPYPVSAEIYDRNGDGRGDSIRIVYSGVFPKDTLPNKILVVWSLGDTISFGLAQLNGEGKYDDKRFSGESNENYWESNNFLKRGGTCKDCADTIVLIPYGGYGEYTPQFSNNIKTAAYGGEVVISWATYTDENGNPVTNGFRSAITDKISPIIITAEYASKGSDGCGTSSTGNYCQDEVYIELSEPVKVVVSEREKESFAYKLIAAKGDETTFEVCKEGTCVPRAMSWMRDSSVTLVYGSFKTDDANSFTPVPGDSVRLLPTNGSNPLEHALKDLAGNAPNPNEIGRRIEGQRRYNPNECLAD